MWVRCDRFCGASMTISSGCIQREPGTHSHPPTHRSAKIKTMLKEIYNDTTIDLTTPITQIYQRRLKQFVTDICDDF